MVFSSMVFTLWNMTLNLNIICHCSITTCGKKFVTFQICIIDLISHSCLNRVLIRKIELYCVKFLKTVMVIEYTFNASSKQMNMAVAIWSTIWVHFCRFYCIAVILPDIEFFMLIIGTTKQLIEPFSGKLHDLKCYSPILSGGSAK